VAGLYAAGEVACVSVHGGNRLGANSLLDTLIFGRRSGADAAERAMEIAMPAIGFSRLRDERAWIDSITNRPSTGRRVSEIKVELGTSMNRNCAVFRDQEKLTEQMEIVQRLKEEAKTAYVDDKGSIFNQDVLGAIELGYLLDCAEATVLSAIERKESRGAHSREDYLERDDENWLKHINVSRNADGEAEISYSPVTITQFEPAERTY
jgi:succinate dehydrogenase / fumarate reductase, flavoprotein subunit